MPNSYAGSSRHTHVMPPRTAGSPLPVSTIHWCYWRRRIPPATPSHIRRWPIIDVDEGRFARQRAAGVAATSYRFSRKASVPDAYSRQHWPARPSGVDATSRDAAIARRDDRPILPLLSTSGRLPIDTSDACSRPYRRKDTHFGTPTAIAPPSRQPTRRLYCAPATTC
jgi:hypothetical protein